MSTDYNQWSSIRALGVEPNNSLGWIPAEERDRIAAYIKYDQIYWNDARQYALRVLDGETPLYIPNARTVVDTTSYFLLKGLRITVDGPKKTKDALDAFLKREAFYSRFNEAKHSGVARGDWVFHMTASPRKAPGTRISLTPVDPSSVFPIYDEDEPGKMIGCHIAVQYTSAKEPDKVRVRRLTYRLDEEGDTRRVSREEAIYELNESWFGSKAKKIRDVIPFGYLDSSITSIPVYWFKNRHWQGEDYGSSELRGLETILQTVSQGDTDVSASLALEGLGVYATDGGRPIDENGTETEWEVAPGRVMEVPSGAYFRRVEGVGSITPAIDQIKYLEEKVHEATGLSDIALGKVDAQTASSGIALAIRFMPTLAKMETRDQHGIDILTQMFYDWKTWHAAFELEALEGDIIPVIGDKLPSDRTAKVNELNNMLDRRVISTAYYREQMEELGYTFPSDIEDQIQKDLDRNQISNNAQEELDQQTPPVEDSETDSTAGDTLENQNSSNNRNRPNESAGTEA